mgnify:CR=1 FL=1
MPKCRINDKNEIINFWSDDVPLIPDDAVEVDVIKPIKAIGSPNDPEFLYTLVDGKATPTANGIKYEADPDDPDLWSNK